MTKLSRAAQTVVNAAVEAGGGYGKATPVLHARLAAALEAVADQVVPKQLQFKDPHGSGFRWGEWAAEQEVRSEILAIAAELRGDTETP